MSNIKYISLIASIFFVSCGESNTKSYQESTPNNVSRNIINIDDIKKESFLDAINSARSNTQDCGEYGEFEAAPPLKWSNKLYNAAYEHSYDMAQNGVVSHSGSNSSSDWTAMELNLGRGSYFYERIKSNGYDNYIIIEENVAGGTYFDNAEVVVQKWLESPGHCKNLMNRYVKDVGLAQVKKNTKYVNYWTLELGALR